LPALVVLAIVVAGMSVVHVAAATRGEWPQYIDRIFVGYDYKVFWRASVRLGEGESPYSVDQYVTPPLPALVNYPVSLLGFRTAVLVVLPAILVAVAGAYGLMASALLGLRTREGKVVLLCGLAVILCSYPFHFLFDRGNIDGFVLLLTCVGLVLVGRRDVAAGFFLALAMAFKVYPALLVAPLAIQRRFRTLRATAMFLMLLVLVTPGLWMEYAPRVARRGTGYQQAENGSIVSTFVLAAKGLEAAGMDTRNKNWQRAGLATYVVLLGLSLWADWKARRRGRTEDPLVSLGLYLPFMVAVPAVVFHYEFVLLLPLIPLSCRLWRECPAGRGRWALMLIAAGVAMSQSQAYAMEQLAGSMAPRGIPGVGLILAMVGCTWHKMAGCPAPEPVKG